MLLGQILQVLPTAVSIGMDDGRIVTANLSDCTFAPQVGHRVQVYYDTGRCIVVLVPVMSNQAPTIVIQNMNTNTTATVTAPQVEHKVNKVVYCVLAFFLGWFGVHKFYARRTGAGILYLLFSFTGLPLLVSFIEGIVALFKDEDMDGNILV